MKRNRENCVYFRQEDGCKWCDKHGSDTRRASCCSSFVKKLTPTEVERVTELQKVWEYLYSHEVYNLCDTISLEIGYIKGKCKEDML